MLSFNPSWSILFDAGVCVAILWLLYMLSRRRPFSALGPRLLIGAGVIACAPVLVLGKVWSLLASLVAVPWLVIEAYKDTEQPLPGRLRALLAAARIIVFLLIIVCLLRPRLAFEHVTEYQACAVVLADISTSMEAKDCPPEGSRYEALKAILDDNVNRINKIRQKCDYRFATFAGTFQRAETRPEAPSGARTNLGHAFAEVMRDLRGAPTAGIVLLSDGRNNGQVDPIRAAKQLGVPVFAVRLGAAKGSSVFTDSSIQTFDCPERIFVDNIAVVTVRAAYDGPEVNAPTNVTLKAYDKSGEDSGAKGEPSFHRTQQITTPKPGKTEDVEFEYQPETEGIKRLVATVTPADKDANVRNNTKEIFVRASKSALRVLLVEGEVRWEYKFLRRAIAAAANIKLMAVNAFLAGESDSSKLLPGQEKDWAGLSLIVLGDIPAGRFTPSQLARIKKFVADGGALLMIGGFNTLGPGGYGSTPVAQVLPVDVKESDAQTLDALRVVPTEDGLEHNILAFGPTEETRKIWESLPPLSGYTKVTGVKPAARVLVRTPGNDPILVVQNYEKGRTAVFAADTTWRWIFNQGKFARYHKAFWRQLVQWLTKSGYGGVGGGIWCETDRLRYLTGDTPVLTVRASGKKVENAKISAVISGPGMKINMRIADRPGQHVLGLPEPMKKSGAYEITVTARIPESAKAKGEKDLEAKTRFVVQEIDIENENPGADPKLLAQVAAVTGGASFEREDASQAFQKILDGADIGKKVVDTYRRLWDNMYMYFALGGLLCVEWIVRKRKGLA